MIKIEELLKTSKKLEGNYSGIYFLFDGDELVYIGKGWNCLLRVAEHTRKDSDIVFNSWNYINIAEENEYNKIEKELIKQFIPKYNKIHKKLKY